MKNKILKFSTVLLIITTLIATNFITVGVGLISYAQDNVLETKTNNQNVGFSAYFKTQSGEKTASLSTDINSLDTKLYLKVEVEKEGYFNGEIKLVNSNFTITTSNPSEYVNNINGNTITLNQITAGTSAEIEINIKPKSDENMDLSLLNMETELALSGTYKDSTEQPISISAARKVTLSLISSIDDQGIQNSLEIITNKLATYNKEQKRIIQVLVKQGLLSNNYPIKNISTQVSVPTIEGNQPEIIEKKVNVNSMQNWTYDYKDQTVKIDMTNDSNNKAVWKKSGNEEIILTYIYDANVDFQDVQITSKENVQLCDGKSLTAQAGTISVSKADEQKDGIISEEIQNNETSIYKGKLYSGIDKQYSTSTKINVNLNKVAKSIIIDEAASTFDTDESTASVYVSTAINKAQMLSVLGEQGTVQIKDQNNNVLTIINNATAIDTNGNIVIVYPDETKSVSFEFSSPEKIGTIQLNHTKTIKATNKNILKNSTRISRNSKVEYKSSEGVVNRSNTTTNATSNETSNTTMTTGNKTSNTVNNGNTTNIGNQSTSSTVKSEEVTSTASGTIELKESTTDAKLEVNKTSLSTVVENKNVEIKAVLKSNSEENDLYKNPTIKIELPQDVQGVQVNSINKLYGDEFTVTSAKKEVENGKQVIIIELSGEQKEYKDPAIEGAALIINANFTLNNKATSKDDSIKMIYTNENANQYVDGKAEGEENVKISIVSPKGLIATNNIDSLGIQTIGEETLTTQKLVKSDSEKQLKVSQEIINNNDGTASNVSILGTFGTNGAVIINGETKQNNVNAVLKSGLTIESLDSSKTKTYYSENENATADVTNTSNGWKEEMTDLSKAKRYLIVVTDMAKSEGMKLSYDIEIPANLEYNQQMYQGYEATYTDNNTGTSSKVNSTIIGLETGEGPQADVKLTANVAGKELNKNDSVKKGEIIQYKVTVANTGKEEIKNAKVAATIPEGTVLVTANDDTNIKTPTYNEVEGTNNKETQIETLKVGQAATTTYEVKVKSDATAQSEIKEVSNVTYGEVTKQTNETVNTVASENNANITVTLKRTDAGLAIQGQNIGYMCFVENNTNQEIKNVELDWNIPDGFKMVEQTIYSCENIDKWGSQDYDMEKDSTKAEANGKATISSIPANGKMAVLGMFLVEKSSSAGKTVNVSAVAKVNSDEYKSNAMSSTIQETNNFNVVLSANSENGYIKAGEAINYTLKVKNNNNIDMNNIVVTDSIPANLSVKEVTVNDQSQDLTSVKKSNNNLSIPLSETAGEEKTVKISTVVNYQADATSDTKISNQAQVVSVEDAKTTSNTVTHILEQNVGVDSSSGVLATSTTNKINGTAWIDSDSNGQKDDTESLMSGITVKLLNTATNEIAKDSNGQEITTTTDNSGFYTLSNVPNGTYVALFEYDTAQYVLAQYKKDGVDDSKNSKVVSQKLTLNNEEKTYAVTDSITIQDSNATNINIGLVKAEKFDLQLEKTISKVVVQNSEGTKTYDYNNETLAKIEIAAKKVAGTTVVIEYNIKVTNIGQVEGYVKDIVDYMPSDLSFSSELNKDWYQKGNNVECNSLANEKLAAGESKTIKLTATKTITEDNTGLINNTAEIGESYNEQGITDINSTAGNKKQGENDMGSADVIISIKTGGEAIYITLGITVVALLGAGIYIIRKKTIKQDII